MKRFVSVLLLSSLLLAQPQGLLSAADDEEQVEDPWKHLNEEEVAYLDAMDAAYGAVADALSQIGEVDVSLSGSFVYDEGDLSLAWMDIVTDASAKCTAAANRLRRPPPPSLAKVADSQNLIADMVDGAFSSCIPLLKGEVRRGIAGMVRDDADPFAGGYSKPRPSELAKAIACVQQEHHELLDVILGGEAALYESANEVAQKRVEEEEAEEAMWNFLLDDCFIATAAYGTPTAREIDVLRTFREGVLRQSPAGRDYIDFYYAASPPIAEFIARHEMLRTVVREGIVDPIVRAVSLLEPLWKLN